MEITKTTMKVGPIKVSRQSNSPPVVEWDAMGQSNIARLYVSHNLKYINSLQYQYIDDAKLVLSPIFGCANLVAPYFQTVTFSDPCKEYITRVSGSITRSEDKDLTSLTIETNAATYGPFGSKHESFSDTKFNYGLGPDNQFGGFHGTSTTSYLVSIGVYVCPIQNLNAISKRSTHHNDVELPIN